MGPAEVLYRIRQAMRSKLEQAGFGLAAHRVGKGDARGRPWIGVMPKGFNETAYCAAADRILSGEFRVFSLGGIRLGFPPQWNRDPKTGIDAPMVFGKSIDYRDERVVGDIKYLWEPNRHLELVTIAQAWYLSGDVKYLDGCRVALDSWFEQCPYPYGPNWVSSLEQAIRLINWSYAWHLLGGSESALFDGERGRAFRSRWLNAIYQHLHFINGYLSQYSSANNHLMGEYAGLFVGAVTWPMWRESMRWVARAKSGLEREAVTQNARDGVNREQATWYHHEVADMMLHCGLIGRANEYDFSKGYWERFEAMLEYLASIMDVNGHVPMFGDADDAVIVRLDQDGDSDVYRSLLATGAVLFGRGDFKIKAVRFDDKSRWLLGDGAAKRFHELADGDVRLPVRREFPEGGYWVLGDQFETEKEVRMIADAGPLGYLSIAAHGHADALSFTLSIYGREILIDPGTYAYHTQKMWREYFRGTSAHNTLRVDGRDQSLTGGNFLWLRHARASCEGYISTSERDEWVASHDGYQGLRDPILHRRRIVLDKRVAEIRVEDELKGTGSHSVEIFWHLAEACVVGEDKGVWIVRASDTVVRFQMPDGLETKQVRGLESPPMGWISRRFDEKQPITTLVSSGRITGTAVLVTRITYGRE